MYWEAYKHNPNQRVIYIDTLFADETNSVVISRRTRCFLLSNICAPNIHFLHLHLFW